MVSQDMEPISLPTPLTDTVYFLAVFRRAFATIQEYAEQVDSEGIVLGGWLGDALHNVPKILWDYPVHITPDHYSHHPESLRNWVLRFPEYLAHNNCPKRLIQRGREIVSPENAAARLDLREDFADYEPAPTEAQTLWRWRLYRACLTLRCTPFQRSTWKPRKAKEVEEYAALIRHLSVALSEIPTALVHWDRFDAVAHETRVRTNVVALPEGYRLAWESLFMSGLPETAR